MRRLIERLFDLMARFPRWLRSFRKQGPGKGHGKPPLRKITNVNVEVDMSGRVTLTWAHPAQRGGQPASGDEFEVRISLKAAAAPDFTPLQTVQGTEPAQVVLANQAGGDYVFGLTLYDKLLDREQTTIEAPFSVPLDDLDPITSVDVTVE